jgi:hypothetical protein
MRKQSHTSKETGTQPSGLRPLLIYVSASCFSCTTAHDLLAQVQQARPGYPAHLIDIDQPDATRPAHVFGTPTYCLGEHIVSLGNPTLEMLIDLIDAEIAG